VPRPRSSSPVKKWRPPPPEWISVFTEAAQGLEGAQQRKMFGYPAAFVNGHMLAGLHEAGLVLRLPDGERETLRALGAKPFEPMPGRIMHEYVVAPPTLATRPAEVSKWLRKAFAYASSLPSKTRR
jgi:TfoX/Sxy family transcriptional regulator of competence genes